MGSPRYRSYCEKDRLSLLEAFNFFSPILAIWLADSSIRLADLQSIVYRGRISRHGEAAKFSWS
jgi:hypothetical protein